MPRPRLPWFKLWVGSTRHRKVVALNDHAFRVWVELMDAAGEQRVRGSFVSYESAAAIIRRKPAEVRQVADAGLMDEAEDGVWMHDWKDWQRWRPEDGAASDTGSSPDEPTIDTGITHESLRNGNGITHEKHTKTRPLARAREDVDVEGDVEEEVDRERDVFPPAATQQPPKGRRRVVGFTDELKVEMEDEFWEALGSRQAAKDCIALAESYTPRKKYTDQRQFLRNWLRRDAERGRTPGKRLQLVVDEERQFEGRWVQRDGKVVWEDTA